MIIDREIKYVIKEEFCDFCNTKIKYQYQKKHCCICKSVVCFTCAIATDYDHLEADYFSGDYPDFYCPTCWKIGKPYRIKILELRDEANTLEEVIFSQWRNNCSKITKEISSTQLYIK